MSEFDNNSNGTNMNGGNSADNMHSRPSYENGYYRNPNPRQDDSYSSANAQSSNPYASYRSMNYGKTSSYTNQTGSENGYNYANYYTNNTGSPSEPPKKKGGKKGLKITAVAVAAAVVLGGSFAGGYFLSKGGSTEAVSSNATAGTAETETTAPSDDSSNAAVTTGGAAMPSLIELASRKDAITIPEIVTKITPSVVGVKATFVGTVQQSSPFDFGYGFGYFGFNDMNPGQTQQKAVGVGTGVIISEDGYIMTNAHVVYDSSSGYGVAQSVEVQMADQETVYAAEIVAYDAESDLAVLKVDQTGLVPAEFGSSDDCQVGELVVAIGNPLGLQLQNTVTCGIISALNREITINDKKMCLIQTDTAINNGNSGGPLINSAGQVIGINSAKMSSSYSSNSASVEGLGFAIPINEAKDIVDDLIKYGYVTGRPQLGITCQDVSEAVSQAYGIPVGVYVVSVAENGAAAKAGIQINDVIIAIDGNTVKNSEELNDYKNKHDAGEQITVTIVRQGQQLDVTLILDEVAAVDNN